MKRKITLAITSVFTLGLMSFGILSDNGKTNKTGRAGEGGCTCHSASLNNAVTVSVTASGTLLTLGYVAGTSYTINVTVAETGQPLFGFDFEALNSSNTSAGTLTAGTSGDNKISGTAPVNAVHTGVGNTGSGTHTFTFTWVAPATGSGAVTFYYSGLAANSNGSPDSGDHWNDGSTVINESTVGIAEQASTNLNLFVFPDPVKESTNVSYSLAENSVVSANLINLNGQVVSVFFDKEEQSAGNQNRTLLLNSSIAKGIYFIAINVNGKNNFKKIVVE